jgi:hypothetical protein
MYDFVTGRYTFYEETGADVAQVACAEGAGGPFYGIVGGGATAEGEEFDGDEGCAEGEVGGGGTGCVRVDGGIEQWV